MLQTVCSESSWQFHQQVNESAVASNDKTILTLSQ